MKIAYISLSLILTFLIAGLTRSEKSKSQLHSKISMTKEKDKDSVLRHVVLFKFKKGTSSSDIEQVENAFSALPSKIPQILTYEWGLNNSPEGLDKGFTHCFFLTFKNERDRAIYLPHPDHKAFGQVLSPHLEDVLVLDYWTSE